MTDAREVDLGLRFSVPMQIFTCVSSVPSVVILLLILLLMLLFWLLWLDPV